MRGHGRSGLELPEEKADRITGEVAAGDYEKLAATDLTRYAPWLKQNVRGQDETVDAVVERIAAEPVARASRSEPWVRTCLLVRPAPEKPFWRN